MKKSILVYPLTALAVGLSAWLTVRLCWALDAENIESTLIGIVNDGAKLCFGVMAFYAIGEKKLGFAALSIACAVISITASMGFFVEASHGLERAAIERTAEYQQFTSQRDRLLQMNAGDMRTADKYESINYLTKAKELRFEVGKRETTLGIIAAKIDMLEQEPPAEIASPMFAGLGEYFGRPPSEVKFAAFSYLSLLLEIVGVVGLAVCMGTTQKTPQGSQKGTGAKEKPPAPIRIARPKKAPAAKPVPVAAAAKSKPKKKPAENGRHDTGTNSGVDAHYKHAVGLIKSGEIRPSLRALQKTLEVGQDVASRFLKAMASDGLLERTDSGRYRVIG